MFVTAHRHALAALLLAGICVPLRAECAEGFDLEHQDSSYECTIGLTTPLHPDTLLSIFADPGAVRALTADADSLAFSAAAPPCCTVSVFYTFAGYRATSIFLRCVDLEARRITMDLSVFRHNWSVLPSTRSVAARYDIVARDNGALLCYRQNVTVDRRIGRLGMRLVRWQLERFRTRLRDFLRNAERERHKGPPR